MNDIERIRMHIEMETEGEVSPIQREPQPADFIAEVERLTTLEHDLHHAQRPRVQQKHGRNLTRAIRETIRGAFT